MAFYRISGAPNIDVFNAPASTPLTANALVNEAAGALGLAASTTSVIAGICLETRVSTDADYASARGVQVDQLGPNVRVYCDNVTGTLTAAMEGQYLKLSSTAGVVADAGTATDTPAAGLVLRLIRYISATSGIFVVNGIANTRQAS